jgi:hypothetical protein
MNLRMPLSSLALAAGLATMPQALRAAQEARPNPSMVVNNGGDTWRVRDSDSSGTLGVVEFFKEDDLECKKVLGTITAPGETFKLAPKTSVRMTISGFQGGGPVVPSSLKGKLVALHLSLEPTTGPDSKGTKAKNYSKLHFVHGINNGELVELKQYKGKIPGLLKIMGLPSTAGDAAEYLLNNYMDADVVAKVKNGARVTVNTENYQDADSGPLWTIDQ